MAIRRSSPQASSPQAEPKLVSSEILVGRKTAVGVRGLKVAVDPDGWNVVLMIELDDHYMSLNMPDDRIEELYRAMKRASIWAKAQRSAATLLKSLKTAKPKRKRTAK
jgi:hypothetical protein